MSAGMPGAACPGLFAEKVIEWLYWDIPHRAQVRSMRNRSKACPSANGCGLPPGVFAGRRRLPGRPGPNSVFRLRVCGARTGCCYTGCALRSPRTTNQRASFFQHPVRDSLLAKKRNLAIKRGVTPLTGGLITRSGRPTAFFRAALHHPYPPVKPYWLGHALQNVPRQDLSNGSRTGC